MAQAAAKKAAAAKASATKTYQPILLGINILYAMLFWIFRYNGENSSLSWATIAVHIVLAALQFYAYLGLTDGNKTNSSSLDLLAVTLLIQFAGAFISHYVYYGLLLVPVWGGWSLYRMFYPAQNNSNASNDVAESDISEVDKERRQKRAERRRQKRN